MKTALTGIKPTGIPHLGNYLGSIAPTIKLSEDNKVLCLIADYHALITIKDKKVMEENTLKLAATILACGLDKNKLLFRQSDIPQIFELCFILNCFTAKGVLNRSHAYKTMVEKNIKEEKDPDTGVNVGLYEYPILMAADILSFGTDLVPVGFDQLSHVEIARDIAIRVNSEIGEVFTIPSPKITEGVKTITGIDGRKMSKNYDNVIPIFDAPETIRKRISKIVTDSKTPEEPKDPDTCNIFSVFKHFATMERIEQRRKDYLNGGLPYGKMKDELAQTLIDEFSEKKKYYDELIGGPEKIENILQRDGREASKIAETTLKQIKSKLGIK